jgi:hypothetical protein
MKIRNGFVSNSSSSSFILALPKVPNTVEELSNILFNPIPAFLRSLPLDNLEDIAKRIFRDISFSGNLGTDDVRMMLGDGCGYSNVELPPRVIFDDTNDAIYAEISMHNSIYADLATKMFLVRTPGHVYYAVSYHDSGDISSECFVNIPYIEVHS